jgi:ADP-heptose:LPS heptosyltransferase
VFPKQNTIKNKKDKVKVKGLLASSLFSVFSRRQAQTVFASRAPYRLGHYPDKPRYRYLAFFYNLYVSMSRARKHEVERILDVLKGIGIEHPLPTPLVVIDQPARDFATDIVEASSARPGSIKKRDSANASFGKSL